MAENDTQLYADEGIRALVLAQTAGPLETLTDQQVGDIPDDGLFARLPFVGIDVLDGAQDYFGADPVVDVEVFAATRAEAKLIAAALSELFLRYPHTVPIGSRHFLIESVKCNRLPVKVPWDDPNIRRQSATYQFSVRR